MDIVLSIVVAVALGVIWVFVLRRTRQLRTLPGIPEDGAKVLDAYRNRRWSDVLASAPSALERPGDGSDEAWRPAVELAFGHSLVESDRPAEAIPHLERGLLLQSALRRAQGGGDAPDAGEAKLRHILGWAYAQTGHAAQARREYRRVLDIPGLDQEVRARVEVSLAALDR